MGCRTRRNPAEMVRICVVGGRLEITHSSKGRGAWLCERSGACFDRALQSGVLERALRASGLAPAGSVLAEALASGGMWEDSESGAGLDQNRR